MKNHWEKFNIHFSIQDLEINSVRKPRDLRGLRNLYNFNLSHFETQDESNLIIFSEKKLGTILGYLRCQASVSGSPLIAKKYYDTFPIERLDLCCLEIVDFEFADCSWERLGFSSALSRAVSLILLDLGFDSVIVHFKESLSNINKSNLQIQNSPFRSPFVYCENNYKSSSVNSSEESNFDVNLLNITFSVLFQRMLKMGLQLWSAPRICDESSQVKVLMGYISPKSMNQIRPFSALLKFRNEGLNAP